MRQKNLFWAVLLILVGGLLLLNNLGILDVNVWRLVGPLFVIGLGISILWGRFAAPSPVETEEVAIPLEGASQARIHVRHGGGRLRIDAGAGPGELLSGTFGGGLDHQVKQEGDRLDVTLRVPGGAGRGITLPWELAAGHRNDWSLGLNSEISLSLDVETGASETRMDLSGLRVTDLQLRTGASDTEVTLSSEAGATSAKIRSGVASVKVKVPSGVAARIRAKSGLADVTVDESRFPRTGDGYQSPDYDTVTNKVDIDIETGVGSVVVR